MALALESRLVGNVTVVTCQGRLVAGAESAALQRRLEALILINPHIVLHLGEVEFIDSSGLGLLVRTLTRAKYARGDLVMCAVSAKVDEVLKVTRLGSIFHRYETEAEAIAGTHQDVRGSDDSFLNPNVLCVDQSQDILAYLRELLKEAGYRVITAVNLSDALILLSVTQPKVVVMGPDLAAADATRAAFHRRAHGAAVVELPRDFSAQDAGEAARHVLQMVGAAMNKNDARPESG